LRRADRGRIAEGGGEVWCLGAYLYVSSDYRSLAAYRRSRDLADEVHRLVQRWPAFERDLVGRQLLRAADSVSANIAEAAGRWTVTDRRRQLRIARGSLLETEHWLEVAYARGLTTTDLTARIPHIARPLSGLIKNPTPS
jgi:four helix bundle protein